MDQEKVIPKFNPSEQLGLENCLVGPPEELRDMEYQEECEPETARQKAYRKFMEERIAAYLEMKNATLRKWIELNLQAIELEKVRLQSQPVQVQQATTPERDLPLMELLEKLGGEDVCWKCGAPYADRPRDS